MPGMRAWHVEAPGPVTGHPLRLSTADDVPEPGPGELLLKVLACGVCRTDLHVTEGDLPPHRPGVTPGHEVVGEVVAVGENRREPRERRERRDGQTAGSGRRRAGRLPRRGPGRGGLAALDRSAVQVLRPRPGEPVPALAVHRLGRRRRLRRLPDRPGGVRAPAAGGLLRSGACSAAVRGHHRLPRAAAGRAPAGRPPGAVRFRRQRAPGRPGRARPGGHRPRPDPR